MATCGNCKRTGQTVAHINECYYERYAEDAQAHAEYLAEQRNERFWENRGVDDGFDDWERRMGLRSYEDLRDEAERGTHMVATDMGVYLEVDNVTGRTVDVG